MPTRSKQPKVVGVLQAVHRSKLGEAAIEDTPSADYTAGEIDEVLIAKAVEWYRIGAQHGALEILHAIMEGKIALREDKQGRIEIIARKKAIEWKQALTVNTLTNRIRTELYTHSINLDDLGFK